MGMEHDGEAFPFHGDDGVRVSPFPFPTVTDQKDRPTREQQFQEPSGIGEKGRAFPLFGPTADEETIRPLQESGLLELPEPRDGRRGPNHLSKTLIHFPDR